MTGPHADRILVILAAGKAKRYGGLKPLAPVGPGGEAILDIAASDAIEAGFNRLVLVLSPATGSEIREHLETAWPDTVDVHFALQESARGTVDAVLAAWDELKGVGTFGVANADDLYGAGALAILSQHLAAGGGNALVGFRLENAVIGSSPVTRGVCQTGPGGELAHIDERRGVVRSDDGTFAAGDGREPARLDPESLVSMNLWAFSTELEADLENAMKEAGDEEVLLPELVARLISPGDGHSFSVLPTDGRCVGVTHPDDLELVQEDVRAQIERHERSAHLWGASGSVPSAGQPSDS